MCSPLRWAGSDREPSVVPRSVNRGRPAGSADRIARAGCGSVTPSATRPLEELPPPVDLDLEVAGAPADARASSGVTPQPKCSNASVAGSQVASTAGPRRWTWPWTSRATGRTKWAATTRRRPASSRRSTSDDAEVRQLVVGQADGRAARGVEDVIERIGVDRRGQAIADGCGADRDLGRLAPGVGRRWSDSSRREQDGVIRADRGRRRGAAGGGRASRARTPAGASRRSRPRLRARRRGGRRQEVEERAQERRLADALAVGGDDDRDARLDEEPDRRGQLGIERARRGSAP